MNKKIVAAIAIILVLLLGWFLFMRKGSSSTSQSLPTVTENPSAAETLRSLLAKGIAQTCTFNANNTQGTMYISGGKVRGDFNATINGTVTASHIIFDNNMSYLWMDNSKSGFKMSFDPNATPAASPSAGSFDASATMNYKCAGWVTDASIFVLPAGVSFRTINIPTAAPATKTGTSGSSNSSQCSYCASLSGDQKTQCLAALNCK